MSVSLCQTCHSQFEDAAALRDHIKKFRSEERNLDQEYAKCRDHDSSNLDPTSMPGELHVCQSCGQSFEAEDMLQQHLENYMLREMLLLGRLACCRLHRSTPELLYKRDNGDECPVDGCKQSCDDDSNLRRHFQKHIECFAVCPACLEQFRYANAAIWHNCKPKNPVALQNLKQVIRRHVTHVFHDAVMSCQGPKRSLTPESALPRKRTHLGPLQDFTTTDGEATISRSNGSDGDAASPTPNSPFVEMPLPDKQRSLDGAYFNIGEFSHDLPEGIFRTPSIGDSPVGGYFAT